MMAKEVERDMFEPPCHKLRKDIKTKLMELLKNTGLSLHKIKQPLEWHH